MSPLMIFTQDNSVIFGFFYILIKGSSFSWIFLLQIQFIFDKLFLSLLVICQLIMLQCCTLDDSCIYDDDDDALTGGSSASLLKMIQRSIKQFVSCSQSFIVYVGADAEISQVQIWRK